MKHSKSAMLSQEGGPEWDIQPGRTEGTYAVFIRLPHRRAYIGELRPQGDGTFYRRIDPKKHIHRNSDSIGICASLLEAPDLPFRWIVVDSPQHGKLITTRSYLLAHGVRHSYRGYEPQLFLAISGWGVEVARNWEAERARVEKLGAERSSQGDLFAQMSS